MWRLSENEAVTGHLAVVLPGGNNDPWTAPVLLPSLALEETGAEVERISYGEPHALGLGLAESAEFNAGVLEQLTEVISRHNPARITFVAKSRGTLFLAAMGMAANRCDVAAIWVTPLLGLEYVRAGIVDKSWPSLVVAGAADPYHDPASHVEVCTKVNADALVIAGANHGLVVEKNVLATVDGYRRLAEACIAFALARS
jgi:pimeloyl-ACP methyl ester carboxylesterase